jgi:hypothetical protein
MLWAEHWIAGIRIDVAGKERLPEGAFIIAAKHHSRGDGFVMFAHRTTWPSSPMTASSEFRCSRASSPSSGRSWWTTAAGLKRAGRWPRKPPRRTPKAAGS